MGNSPKPFRLKLTDVFGNTSYLVRRNDKISYVGGDETPLALSNVARGKATELRFALEDAADGADAAKAVRKLAEFAKKVEVVL